MVALSGLLVTVRSAKQGAEMMANKLSAEYGREISTLRINPDDMHQLAVSEGQRVRIASPYGEAIVTCQGADVPQGSFSCHSDQWRISCSAAPTRTEPAFPTGSGSR